MVKLFGKNYLRILNKFIENKNKFKEHQKIIDNFKEYNDIRYMVLDTETIGLPYNESVGMPNYTLLKKYDKARMIQLCSGHL